MWKKYKYIKIEKNSEINQDKWIMELKKDNDEVKF